MEDNSRVETIGNLKVRKYGRAGPMVIVLHGGPGAAGSSKTLAQGLSVEFSVIEPLQRSSCQDEPLTVARHIADLHSVVKSISSEDLPALVGESWGAMLALAYAAEYPSTIGPIVLIGCGTFEKRSRALAAEIRKERIAAFIDTHPQHADDLFLNLDDQIMKWHHITDNYDPVPAMTAIESFDMKAHTETWRDMIRCQEIGWYPQVFKQIESPVIMLHGDYDPHPGKMIRDHLKIHIPQLQYVEFEKCGHNPAIEKAAKEKFYTILFDWLLSTATMNQ